jgi:putative ABC transport system permease protein
MYYFPFEQQSDTTMTFAIRTRTQSDTLMSTVRQTIAAIDPGLPLYEVRTMPEWIDRALVSRRVPMYLSLAFGLIGLFLSAVGIYGVLAYGVEQRRRELGVRVALGSSSGNVFGLVLRGGLRIVAIGLILGLAGSYMVGRLMQSQLYDVAPMEATVVATVVVVLGSVAVSASVIPAWRATKIDPMLVLGK